MNKKPITSISTGHILIISTLEQLKLRLLLVHNLWVWVGITASCNASLILWEWQLRVTRQQVTIGCNQLWFGNREQSSTRRSTKSRNSWTRLHKYSSRTPPVTLGGPSINYSFFWVILYTRSLSRAWALHRPGRNICSREGSIRPSPAVFFLAALIRKALVWNSRCSKIR